MKCCFLLFLLFTGLAWGQEKQSLDELMSSFVQEKHFSGVVLISKHGKVVFNKAYGENIALDSKFGIGSISKSFTAFAIMLLADEGKLKVTDKVSEYVEVPPHWKDITIHHLLTHTAGIQKDIPQAWDDFMKYHTPEELFRKITEAPLLQDAVPGANYFYSNNGYSVLAYIIEKLSKNNYSNFLKERLFLPAGMTDTGHVEESFIPGLAAGHFVKNGAAKRVSLSPEYFSNFIGSGSLYSTSSDMLKWMNVLKNREILSKKSWKKLLTRHVVSYENENYKSFYGYGWILEDIKKDHAIWHAGSLAGFASDITYLVDEDYVGIILSDKKTEEWYLGGMSYKLLMHFLSNSIKDR